METHETYVSLEVAKLLKQAGFNWEVYRCYETLPEKKKIFGLHLIPYQGKARKDVLPAPSLAVAQKWLRGVKNISVEVNHGYEFDYNNSTSTPTLFWKFEAGNIEFDADEFFDDDYANFKTYEEALEAGIKKCLTFLLKEK